MVTKFTDDTVLINRYWATTALKPEMPVSFSEKIDPIINDMLSGNNPSDYSETELGVPGEEPSSKFFLEAIFPAPRLIIAGAGHIGRTLAQLADMIGFDVTIIDDRQQYANPRKIPEGSHFIVGDIGQEIYNLQKIGRAHV